MVRVVIIGGSFAGADVAQQLERKLPDADEITLIAPNRFFYYNIGSPRTLVNQNWKEMLIIPMDKGFSRARLVHDKLAVKIEPGRVTLDDGSVVEFDKCVVAIGAKHRFPWNLAGKIGKKELEAELDALTRKVKEANEIVVVGGGAVGVEVVGELCSAYPEKKVTLIESGSTYLSTPRHKFFQSTIESSLATFPNFHAKLNTRVVKPDIRTVDGPLYHATITTSTGETMTPDITLVATGMVPNTFEGLPMDATKHIDIDPGTLRVKGYDHVWALGDCINVDIYKLSYFIRSQATFVADAAAGRHKPSTRFEGHRNPVMMLTIGKTMGTGLITLPLVGTVPLPRFLVQYYKSDFAANMKWDAMKVKQPVVED